MTPSDLPEIFLVKGLWLDRKIPNFQVRRPNVFFSRAFRRVIFFRDTFYLLKNQLFKLKYLNTHMTALLNFVLIIIYDVSSSGKMKHFCR